MKVHNTERVERVKNAQSDDSENFILRWFIRPPNYSVKAIGKVLKITIVPIIC